eukprot:11124479-Heterocapsa_arctica.AAC.1
MAALLRYRWWNGGLLCDVAGQLGIGEEQIYRVAMGSEKHYTRCSGCSSASEWWGTKGTLGCTSTPT